MTIEQADWADILVVLRETVKIWSAGLSPSCYREYIWKQANNCWSRKNLRFMIRRQGKNIKASCKVYNLEFKSGWQSYSFLGIGALYTQEHCRNEGFGGSVIKDVIALAKKEGKDGVVLFSEIGSYFYENFGFAEAGAKECRVDFSWSQVKESKEVASERASVNGAHTKDLIAVDINWLRRKHSHWLKSQSYGIARSEDYWRYKIWKEDFFYRHSRLVWPKLKLIALDTDSRHGSYAIVEESETTLRILEIVADEENKRSLWHYLLERASRRGLNRLRTWEATIPSYLSSDLPAFFRSLRASQAFDGGSIKAVQYIKRDWGRFLILPFGKKVADWVKLSPCPILELDHI